MPKIFKTNRSNNRRYIVLQLIGGLAAVAVWPISKILYLNSPVSASYYYIIGSVLIVTIVRESLRTRISEIEFNIESQQIIFRFEKFLSGTRQKSLLFKYAKLEIDTQVGWRSETLTLYFYANKMCIFNVGNSKDGFSKKTLMNIRDFARELSLPISKY